MLLQTTSGLNLDFEGARKRLKKVALHTPLQYNINLSRRYKCHIYLKREDLQVVRSYKLRGAYNMMSQLTPSNCKKVWFAPVQATMHRDLPIPAGLWA